MKGEWWSGGLSSPCSLFSPWIPLLCPLLTPLFSLWLFVLVSFAASSSSLCPLNDKNLHIWALSPHFWGFSHSSVGKESTCNAGETSSIPESGRSSGERIGYPLQYSWTSLVAQLVKNLLAMWETWFWSLGWEDPLKKGKARVPSPHFWPFSSFASFNSLHLRIAFPDHVF